jgi:hypothetical protein
LLLSQNYKDFAKKIECIWIFDFNVSKN